MRGNLGELVRQARLQRGWEQSELALRLGSVGQQTVSGWERGRSRPQRPVIAQLAGLLDISEERLLAAAGYEAPQGADPADDPAPASARPATLPFQALSPEEFENFSADLARHLFPEAHPIRNGPPSGSRQEGADVIMRTPSGELIAIQCKQVKEFGAARVRRVVNEMRLDAAWCYLYLSRPASPEARKEIARHPRWHLRDAYDLSADVRYLPDQDAAIRLVETYFGAAYREKFLGLEDPGPWLTPDSFFGSEAGGRIYTHGWTLVGRDADLNALSGFLGEGDRPVAVIAGRGGTGKSRLLREFARAAEQQAAGCQVRFLARNAVTGPRAFEQLPSGGQVVVVIDDAHDRDKLGDVISGILRARPDAKIVLSLRPHGRGQLRSDLRQAGLHWAEVQERELGDLDTSAAEALAAEVLGSHAVSGVSEQLAALGADCPLLIVVGGALICRGQLDQAGLASGTAFREEIMAGFRDAIAAAGGAGGGREILNAIAALQPFRLGDPAFQRALSDLAGRPFDQLISHVRLLEEAAVLLRRGDSLRVVPDLLGDAVLAEAALDAPSGTPTGYLDRVLACAEGDCLLHVLVNASRVDWQSRASLRVGRSLVEALWPAITRRFRDGDSAVRLRLLDVLRKVAFFQPAEVIELVRWVMTAPGPTDSRAGKEVLRALPGVLENAAYNLQHLRLAVDLLWELAKFDDRPTGPHPGHPVRILRSLAEYSAAKPLAFHELIVSAAAGWLQEPGARNWPHSPFEVLEPLLATTVMAGRLDRQAVRIRKYAVTAAAVRGLRKRVLDLAFSEARSADPRRAVDAIRAIGSSIRYENPADDGELRQWTPQFTETVSRIGELMLAAGPELDPVVAVAARRVLSWHARHSPTGTREAAEAAMRLMPASARHDLALALHDGWGHLLPRGDNVAESERLREDALRAVATKVIREWPDEILVDQIEERLAVSRRAFPGTGSPRPFIWTLVTARPAVARVICQRVARDSASILREILPVALSRLAETDPDQAMTQALALIAARDPAVTRFVAEAFGYARGNRANLLDGEAELLRTLLSSGEPEVRCLAVTAVTAVARSHPALALDLITFAKFADSQSVAEAVAAAFAPPSPLSWADLPESQADQILNQLRDCLSIDSHAVAELLAEIAKGQPGKILSLLKERVQSHESKDSAAPGYQPLPTTSRIELDVKAHKDYPMLLRGVLDWVAEGDAMPTRHSIGSEIFAMLAGEFDEQAKEIILHALGSDDTPQATAAAAILRTAPGDLAWDYNFASQALRAAAQHGPGCAKAASSSLLAAAINGSQALPSRQLASRQAEARERLTRILQEAPLGSVEARFYESLARWAQNLLLIDDQADIPARDGRNW